jgi:hypothetical protein
MAFIASILAISVLAASVNGHAVNIVARDLSQRAQLDGLTFDLPNLPHPTSSVKKVNDVPGDCQAYLGDGKECASTMAVVSVQYEDCGDPWTICRCDDANISMDDAVQALSRVPIGLRRHVGTVMVMPDDSTHAYTWPDSGEIHFFGQPSQRTWIHEVSQTSECELSLKSNVISLTGRPRRRWSSRLYGGW